MFKIYSYTIYLRHTSKKMVKKRVILSEHQRVEGPTHYIYLLGKIGA